MSRKGSQSGRKAVGEEVIKIECPCGSCKKHVGEKEERVQCEICSSYFHCSCQNVSAELYEVLIRFNKDISWFCEECRGGAEKVLGIIQALQKRIEEVSSKSEQDCSTFKKEVGEMLERNRVEVEDVKGKVQLDISKLRQEIGELQEKSKIDIEKVRGKVQEDFTALKEEVGELHEMNTVVEIKKFEERLHKFEATAQKIEVEDLTKALIEDGSWTEVVKKHINDKISNVSGNVSGMQKQIEETKQMAKDTKQMAENEREIELRRRNVVIFNIPEKADAVDWKKQREEDLNYVIEMMGEVVGEDIDKNEIGKLFRLGHREYDGSESSRPLLVEFIQGSTKNFVMQNINKLRSIAKYSKVVISHDMPTFERQECKKLVQEAKLRQEHDTSGEFIYRVRGLPGQLKIVKIKKRF